MFTKRSFTSQTVHVDYCPWVINRDSQFDLLWRAVNHKVHSLVIKNLYNNTYNTIIKTLNDISNQSIYVLTFALRSEELSSRASVSPIKTSLCAVTMRLFPLETKTRGGWFPWTLVNRESMASARQER